MQVRNTQGLLKKHDLKGKDFWELFKYETELQELKAFHKRHIKSGVYYKKELLLQRIQELKKIRATTKAVMLEVVEFIEAEGSMDKALIAIKNQQVNVPAIFKQRGSEEAVQKFKMFLKKSFSNRNMSPLTLPDDYEMDAIDNSYTILFEK